MEEILQVYKKYCIRTVSRSAIYKRFHCERYLIIVMVSSMMKLKLFSTEIMAQVVRC